MSDLPSNDQTSDNPATSDTDPNENQTSDQMEQKIDAQISQSIGEQQQQESQENIRLPDENTQQEEHDNDLIDEDREPVPEDPNEPEDEEEEGPQLRIFNHRNINILRVLNEMIAEDPVDLTDEEDIEGDEDDPGFVFDNDTDEEDLETMDESTNQEDDANQIDDYNNAIMPDDINYDTALPSTHNYLGENFEEISAPKTVNEENDELQIPLLPFPGTEIYWRHTALNSSNDIQLLPGQIMPLFFYAPLQVQMIKKRMKDKDPTIGFALTAKFFKQLVQQQTNPDPQDELNHEEETRLGILAEIISARDESTNEDVTSMMHGTDGLVIKVRGRERFRILRVRREITGCLIASVKILPDIILTKNPLIQNCLKSSKHILESYLHRDQSKNLDGAHRTLCTQARAESLNTLPFPAWIYRKYDCDYTIYLIVKELNETFKQKLPFKSKDCSGSSTEENSLDIKDPLFFSNWLLKNFPFNDKMRIDCLKLNCVNQRLIHMYKLLKNFTNINCQACGIKLCSKSDVFSLSKQGFMNAFLNPGGFVHETLTVYKLINYRLSRDPPSTQHSWFPGYGWQILSCKNCGGHLGWKFSTTNEKLTPQKFWGLTRKSICHTYSEEVGGTEEIAISG